MSNIPLTPDEHTYALELSQTMLNWEQDQIAKLKEILGKKGLKLTKANIEEIIAATRFSSICSAENAHYCPLYLDKKQCHEKMQDLNCGLCNCPNYDAKSIETVEDENTRILVGKCRIQSRHGSYQFGELFKRVGVWSCNECPIHHSETFIRAYLKRTLKE